MNENLFNRLNYYSFQREQYRSCREQIAAENWKSARILNHILMVMMGVYALLSLSGVIRRSFFRYYIMFLAYTVIVEALFVMPRHRESSNIRETGLDIGLSCAGLMLFGIIASIVDPNQVATSFLVMQTLVALFLNYSLGYLMLFEFVGMLIFDASSYVVKAPVIASGDVLNAFSFFLVSGFIAYFFHKERIRHYLKSNHYHFMSHVDSLTGFLNHQYFFEETDRIIGSGKAGKLVFAVMDIDHFKSINDRFGHQEGDICIRAVTTNMLWSLLHTAPESCEDLIQTLFPEGKQAHIENLSASYHEYYNWGNDYFEKAKVAVGRIGGDEFATLVGGPDPMERVMAAEDAIRSIKLPDGSNITCSIGCVQITKSESSRSVYKCADIALYEAKKSGRDRICSETVEKMHHV
ncbi:MAG: GGDEF domain-containing protein [Bilifractor sp.]|jgi:GGDEF domain-containing protein